MRTLLVILNLGPLASILLNQQIIPYIKETGSWAKLMDNIWLIKTENTPAQVRDDIRGRLGNLGTILDKVMVFDVSKSEWASYNFSAEISNWIRGNI